MAAPEREQTGCWHHDFAMFCTQCDPASYGPCEDDCELNHEHNDGQGDDEADDDDLEQAYIDYYEAQP